LIKDFDNINSKKTSNVTNIESKIIETNNTSNVIQEINQIPYRNSPKVVRVIKTKGLKDHVPDSPKHTHYHSEYDLSSPRKKDPNNYHRRFNYRQVHKLAEFRKHKHHTEQFQPGYCSEPEIIEYSLDRSWINSNNNEPVSFETIESVNSQFANYVHNTYEYNEPINTNGNNLKLTV
jgi:hypothetical protein